MNDILIKHLNNTITKEFAKQKGNLTDKQLAKSWKTISISLIQLLSIAKGEEVEFSEN